MKRSPLLRLPVLWAALAIGTALAAAASVLWHTHGRFLAPLDDAYIFLVYAGRLAGGHPFSFNPGNPASTGATSLLYTLLLSPLAAVAGRNEFASFFGILAINTLLLWWSLRSAWLLAKHLTQDVLLVHSAVIASVLGGPMIWGFFCGLDTGLMIALTLALWECWTSRLAARNRHGRWTAVALSVALAMARPEGAFLALGMGLAAAWADMRQGQRLHAREAVLTGLGAFVLALLPPMLVTGSLMPSSGWAKTRWASPTLPVVAALSESVRFAVDALKGVWAGCYPSEAAVGLAGDGRGGNEVIYCFPPFAIVLFLLGVVPSGASRFAGPLGGLVWLLGFILVSAVLPVGWHHHRYLIPLFPVFTLVSFAGIARIGGLFDEPARRIITWLLAIAWLVFNVPGQVRHLVALGESAEGYFEHHRRMADELESYPVKGAVAATDVGIIRFFGTRRVVDLKGLTSPRLAPAALRGWGSLYDEFKSMPVTGRPVLAALHQFRDDVNAEQLERVGILSPILSLPHPRFPSTFTLYSFKWFPAGRTPTIKGWSNVDEVDCGLPASEKSHAYHVNMRSRESSPYNCIQARSDPSSGEAVGDGGWVINGSETFTVRARPNHPLILLMRTFAPRPSAIRISINGFGLDAVPIAAQAERFQTIIAAQALSERVLESNRISITCDWPRAAEYSSFHYWALQPSEE
jgi:hypothetical protein